jgi:hypothetical protein
MSCTEPRLVPPSQSARQAAVWSLSPSSLLGFWDFRDPSSFGASSKLFKQFGESLSSKSGNCKQTVRKIAQLQHAHKVHGPAFASCHRPGGWGATPSKIKVHTPDAAAQRQQPLPLLGDHPSYQCYHKLPVTGITATERKFRLRLKKGRSLK